MIPLILGIVVIALAIASLLVCGLCKAAGRDER